VRKIMSHPLPFTGASLRLLALAALGMLLGAAPLASAQAGPTSTVQRSELELRHRAETRARYAQPAWTRGVVRAGLDNDLELAGWSAGPLQSDRGLLTRSFHKAGDEKASPSFVLETCVEDSVDAAQEQLVVWLAGLQSPQRMPSLAEIGLAVGDAGFAGRAGAGPEALAWIAFVRGNVAVRVSACDAPREPGLDLGALATAVDLAIRHAPVLETGLAPAKPRIEALSLPRATAIAGMALRLDVAIADPAFGKPHLEWVVGGPGQGYVEQAADGSWQLHTTGPGAISLALEVTGSTGTWARHEIALNVLDD